MTGFHDVGRFGEVHHGVGWAGDSVSSGPEIGRSRLLRKAIFRWRLVLARSNATTKSAEAVRSAVVPGFSRLLSLRRAPSHRRSLRHPCSVQTPPMARILPASREILAASRAPHLRAMRESGTRERIVR